MASRAGRQAREKISRVSFFEKHFNWIKIRFSRLRLDKCLSNSSL